MAADPAIGRADVQAHVVPLSGPQAALEGLYARHGNRVLSYCRRRLRSHDEAEDALQTTFLYAYRGLQRGVVPEVEIAWLLKIAHNVCLSQWDTTRRRRRLELVQDPEQIEAFTPDEVASGHENVVALETALGDLTDLQRRAILLREWRGLSYQEIADELGLTTSAVETLIFRARRALAAGLEQQDVRSRRLVGRFFDLGGLASALKSLLGLGGGAKVAAGLVGVAVIAGSVSDVAERPAAEAPRPAAVTAPRTPTTLPTVDPNPVRSDPQASTGTEIPTIEKPRTRKPGAPQIPGPGEIQAPGGPGVPPLGEVTNGLNQTVQGLGGTLNGVVGGLNQTLNQTVGGLNETVNQTVGGLNQTVGGVTGTVLPQVNGVLNGVLGSGQGQGGLLQP